MMILWQTRIYYYSALGEYKHMSEEKIINCIGNISVELVDKCLHSLQKAKACGPDDLCAEHLLYAHPSLVVYLTALFKSILLHSYVPQKFGAGICIPLIKDKTGNTNDLDNYSIITLSPVISKLFELVLMSIIVKKLHSLKRFVRTTVATSHN